MTERVETVRLTANITNYIAGMEKARLTTLRMANDSAARLALTRNALRDVSLAVGAVGVVAGVAVALAVARFAQFDQAMSNVKAVTQETAANMQLLRDAALEAGQSTVFTAIEAANAIEELGKNGLTTAQILGGGLTGALALAASGQLEVARAAEITAITMKQFKLSGEQVPHIADLLAAGAGKAAGDVEDLAQALAQAGLVAHGTGLTVEETTGILAAFADSGLLGSDSGTSLKTALQRLTPISGEAKKAMDDLNISAYDAQGKFIGAAAFAGVLQDRLKGLTAENRNAALAQIFGTDAVRAATVLYEQGAAGIAKYIEQTNDSGYAAKVAADRLDNLLGDIEQLGGAFDTYIIRQGSGANQVMRESVQALTFLVEAAGDVPKPVLDAALAIAGLGAATALTIAAAVRGAMAWNDFKAAMATLGINSTTAAVKIGAVGVAVGIATLALSAFVMEQAASAGRVDSFRDSLDKATGSLTAYTRELVVKSLQEKGAFEDAKRFGITQKELTDAVIEGGDALKDVQDKLEAHTEGLTGAQLRAAALESRYNKTSTAISKTRDELSLSQQEWANAAAATDDASGEMDDFASSTSNANTKLDTLLDRLGRLGGAQLDLREAQRDVNEALLDFSASISENGATFDISTEAGIKNQAALDHIVETYKTLAQRTVNVTHNAYDAIPVIQEGRQAFIDQAVAAGMSADEAARLADKLELIPQDVAATISVQTGQAEVDIKNFIDGYSGRTIWLNVATSYAYNSGSVGGIPGGFDDGGYTGNISPRAIAGFVHGREFVSTAETTAIPENRRALEYMHRGGVIRGYAGGGFVEPVGPTYVRSYSAGSPMVASATADAGLAREIRALADAIMTHPTVVQLGVQPIATALRDHNRATR